MKKFLEVMNGIKRTAGIYFSAIMLIYVVVGWFLGQSEMPFNIIIQSAAISLAGAAFQYYVFVIIKRLHSFLRIAVFASLHLLLLVSFAITFEWFPTDNALYWLAFVGIYAVVIAIIAGVYEVYFRITGKVLNDMLNTYKTDLRQLKE